MPRALRVDANQAEVVSALRKVGCRVGLTHMVSAGFPDLVVGIPSLGPLFRPKRVVFVEVKDGSRPPSERRLTPDQERWHAEWSGYPVFVIESVEQALELVK